MYLYSTEGIAKEKVKKERNDKPMKNPGKTVRAAVLLLVLCMISTAMMGGTFAKYTSEYAGADMALIAKWEVTPKVGTDEFAVSPAAAVDLDLFSHAYDTNILATAGTSNPPIIAPGVEGDFVLDIANTGDVAAKMTFDFAVSGTASTAPIEYSLDNSTWGDLDDLDTNLEVLNSMKSVAETNGTASQTVYWRWPYEASTDVYDTSSNEADTALGTASAEGASRSTYILTITATATQIAPATE